MNFFKIINPSSKLAPYIRHYWHFYINPNQVFIDKIVPIGCVYMLFHLGENLLYDYTNKKIRPRVFVCGQDSEHTDVGSNGNTELLTVVFQPYAARTFFNMPMNLIYRQRIDVNDFDDNKIKELAKRISESCSATEAIILIERFMAERLDNSYDYHLKRICTVTNNMLHNPNHDLHELSETACLSSKQFVRVFREEVGASPKVVSRIMRMHKALFLLRRKNLSLIEIAYKCGFSDQAHMNKEFKTFTNCTPLEYLYSYQLDKDPYAEYMFASSDEFKV